MEKFHPLSNLDRYQVILASGSPRRKELLELLDIAFSVDTSHSVDETVPSDVAVDSIPAYLSKLKAEAYPLSAGDNKLVITADTVVILDGKLLGKPKSREGAIEMLNLLQGRTQRVVTGVTIRTAAGCETWSAESEVEFAELTCEEIEYYIDKYQPLDKAGAYGIQEWIGAAAISGIRGSFYNVMGLPVHRLYNALKKY
ncbi:MAG: septum formation protein Maf [Duncaniella sp.]|nr:septum formation protein Maf [Duncaniella sp.]